MLDERAVAAEREIAHSLFIEVWKQMPAAEQQSQIDLWVAEELENEFEIDNRLTKGDEDAAPRAASTLWGLGTDLYAISPEKFAEVMMPEFEAEKKRMKDQHGRVNRDYGVERHVLDAHLQSTTSVATSQPIMDSDVFDKDVVSELKSDSQSCREKHPGFCITKHIMIKDEVETFHLSLSHYLKARKLTLAPDGTVLLCIRGSGVLAGDGSQFVYWLWLGTQLQNPMFQVYNQWSRIDGRDGTTFPAQLASGEYYGMRLEYNVYELGAKVFTQEEDCIERLTVDQVVYRDLPGIGEDDRGKQVEALRFRPLPRPSPPWSLRVANGGDGRKAFTPANKPKNSKPSAEFKDLHAHDKAQHTRKSRNHDAPNGGPTKRHASDLGACLGLSGSEGEDVAVTVHHVAAEQSAPSHSNPAGLACASGTSSDSDSGSDSTSSSASWHEPGPSVEPELAPRPSVAPGTELDLPPTLTLPPPRTLQANEDDAVAKAIGDELQDDVKAPA